MTRSQIVRILTILPLALLAVFIGGGATDAGPRVILICEVGNDAGVCEVGPHFSGTTYAFTTTGRAFLPNPSTPTSPGVQFACQPGQSAGAVQVTATFTDGSMSTAQRTVCPLPREDEGPTFPF